MTDPVGLFEIVLLLFSAHLGLRRLTF